MKNIADHILDIVENSIRAQAKQIEVLISIKTSSNILKLSFVDDGKGMSEEVINKLQNPFFSTRKTRRIGMGIPLLTQNCEMSGGRVSISSKEGRGTTLVATFEYDNLDRPPLGDIPDAIYFLTTQHPEIRFIFDYTFNTDTYRWDTKEIKETLEDIPLNAPEVKEALMDLLRNNINKE